MERIREPDRKDQRERPEDLLAMVRKRIKKKTIQNVDRNKCSKQLPPLWPLTPRNPLPSCPACGTRGPVRHIVGPCPGLHRALHGAEQGVR